MKGQRLSENSSAFPDIPVTAPEILRQVGHGAYTRGQKYMREAKVARYSYDESTRTLSGTVEGSTARPYQSQVIFPRVKAAGSLAFSSNCTCPVGYDCKHAVALMLTAIDRSAKAKKALTASSNTWKSAASTAASLGLQTASELGGQDADSQLPAWRRALSHTLAARPANGVNESAKVPGALELKITVASAFGASGMRAGKPAQVTLSARPVMKGARGKWIKGGLSWESFMQSGIHGFAKTDLYTEHEQWFTDFYAIVRPSQSSYTSHRDWVNLSYAGSALLWQILARAEDIGLPFVMDGQEISVDVASSPEVLVQASLTRDSDDESTQSLTLNPVLVWKDLALSAQNFHKMGEPRRGFIALNNHAQKTYETEAQHAQRDTIVASALAAAPPSITQDSSLPRWYNAQADIIFIPLDAPLNPVTESLVSAEPLTVPASELEEFYSEFYAQLSRSVDITSVDEQLELPAVQKPELVLFVDFDEANPLSARTAWKWAYPAQPVEGIASGAEGTDSNEHIFLPALGYPGETHAEIRDADFETRVLRAVKKVRPTVPFTRRRWENWDTRALVEDALPELADIAGVHIEVTGEVPEFKELTGEPKITVRVDETRKRDWFGLAIAVKAEGWYVGFSEIFEALNRGQTHMLLGNGTYFSLDRPEFLKLQELITEARTLNERGKGKELTITRHQAGLWEELEELASSTETVASWDTHVQALLDAGTHNAPAVPAELDATLRPYQVEGFNWLTFLWRAELGGVLADDMGLGKTMQTIALMVHAQQEHRKNNPDEDFAPFLVVAPTSVVPNWVHEIQKFAPSLDVVSIYESQAKSKTPLPHTIAGADVVVTSYALFRIDEQAYIDAGTPTPWNGLILDEAQFVKNAKTKAHRVARETPARFKLAVTGTPLENNLMELWSMFSITAPGLFPSARAFKDFYATPIESGEETSALAKLRARVRPLMLRRTKEVVATDLPEKTDQRVDVPLAPAHRRVYDTHLQRERQKILGLVEDFDKNRFTIFNSLTTLRRLALDASLIDGKKYEGVASSKLDYLEENLPEVVGEGHRALIFSQFTGYLKLIAARLDEMGISYLYLDGAARDRAALLDAWARGDSPIFLISLKAGGFGLNLTQADYVFIMDPWWNPAAEEQAVDRVHRIGQSKNVMVYRLVSAGTIEEKVMELKESKAALFDAVVDDGEFFSSQLDAEQVHQLLMDEDSES